MSGRFGGRTLARAQALQLLFQADVNNRTVEEVLSGDYAISDGPLDPYGQELVSIGWVGENVCWHSAPKSTGVPIYRQFNPYAWIGTHNYTTSTAERDHLVSLGWVDEGVAWYGV